LTFVSTLTSYLLCVFISQAQIRAGVGVPSVTINQTADDEIANDEAQGVEADERTGKLYKFNNYFIHDFSVNYFSV